MKYLKQLCNLYWARPENALWVNKVMNEMDQFKFKGTKLDLMCGHGLWSFINAGGELDLDWDSYKDIGNLDNYQKGVDIQDHFSGTYNPSITKKPDYRFEYGLDWKENNLKKCEKLDFYDNLVQADCNNKLPFDDETFDCIFSNTIYWVDDIENIMSEVSRTTKKNGQVCLINYLPSINNYIEFYKKNNFPSEWIDLVDRNRSKENKHIFSIDQWKKLYNKHGFKTLKVIPTANQKYAHIWNIGLRPFAGKIIKLANNLDNDGYKEFKMDWVDTLYTFLEPYANKPYFYDSNLEDCVEAIFILEK